MTSLFQMEFNPLLDVKSILSGTAFITQTHKNNLENIKDLKTQCLSLERNQIDQNIYIILMLYLIYIEIIKNVSKSFPFKFPPIYFFPLQNYMT